ncbi:transporter substrate-binding domain-containing protein [Phyllobacterium endophyticum]|uniref:ABC transporter substrate-binding protein n=1 Tax=Phyllobacterium endophyticum TaxID=1149773 RepID=A0A2P7ARY4_9HYPH|nr:transporter substrate-binding domain-containing protein [Phyllobacterium endophyticum]MBB3236688.1 octopine/nopaline transport system substrate-binding protein [Phyllobacterium endophyticum]PSH56984.1 ABC transporter substrate-binding protein [Phyllobacterium endophyticum]TYR39671.1 transporter substrate-binding domain-containing protein [Phyllobacterium endophyticum]
MNSLKLPLSLLFAGAIVTQASAQDGKMIRIATEGAFPPWNAVDTSGKPVGFDIDVGTALCARAKFKCEFVTQAWDGIIPALTVGKFDAIMAGMSVTEKRKQVIAFSKPYALTSNYFVVRKSLDLPQMAKHLKLDLSSKAEGDKSLLQALKESLKGKVIGVQGSTNAEAFVREYFGDTIEVRTYDKQDNLNLDLVAGRIDVGLADYSVWKAFLESKDGAMTTLYGPRISGGLFGPGVGIGLRKQDMELVQRFDNAIDSIKVDGTLKEISLKWFGADLVSK